MDCVFERLGVRGVINDETAAGILEIAGNEAFESLLTSCVPELKSILFFIIADIFDQKVDADGGLLNGKRYIIGCIEGIIDESVDDGSFSGGLISKKNNFVFYSGDVSFD